MPEFIPGLELARLYYEQAVRPILQSDFPDLTHSAALIGPGSEVLGFDTEMSADHNWGPQVTVFLSQEDHAQLGSQVWETLAHKLPFSFRGHPTHFEDVPDDTGTAVPRFTDRRPINHRVHITTLHSFVKRYVGIEVDQELTLLDWLTTPEQKLRSLVAGAVYHDGLNVLQPLRAKLAHYPHDVWLYLLSAQWRRIGQEEPFVGRSGVVRDEVGSAVIAARLVRDVMRLCFFIEREYAPYSKWFGTAFGQLDCAPRLTPVLQRVLRAATWRSREKHLCAAYAIMAGMHNGLAITEPVSTKVSQFHDRPFKVIHAEVIAERIWEVIADPEVQALPLGVGKIDQYVDNTDVLSDVERCRALGKIYAAE